MLQDKDKKLEQELTRLCRVLKVLHEYVMECDAGFCDERTFVPLYRACRGSHMTLSVRFPNQSRQMDDLEIWTHSNETLGSLRRQINQRLKLNSANVKLELFLNGELIETVDDRRILAVLPIRDKSLLTGKLSQVGGNLVSSPDSSSDSSTSSPRHHYQQQLHQHYDGPNVDMEKCLPGVIMAQQKNYCHFLLQLADLGTSLNFQPLQEASRALLKLIPADKFTVERLKNICVENSNKKKNYTQIWEKFCFGPSPSQTLYYLEACYSLLIPASGKLQEITAKYPNMSS